MMRNRNARIKVAPRLSSAALAAARPLAGVTHAASIGWDRSLVIRSAAGASHLVLGHAPSELRGLPLAAIFERPDSLADALSFGTARPMRLTSGRRVGIEAGPCPGGAVAIVRRPTHAELELGDLASALGHELRNAFASVMLAIQSLTRHEEVASERGRRRVMLAERELRRIECVLRGLQEVGRSPSLRPVEASPERLVAEALANLGRLENERIEVTIPVEEGPPALLDAPRVCLAIEEMLRHGVRSAFAGGKVMVSVERRQGELAIIVLEVRAPGGEARTADQPGAPPDIGLAVIQGVARAHGGHSELSPHDLGNKLTLVLPQRPVLS